MAKDKYTFDPLEEMKLETDVAEPTPVVEESTEDSVQDLLKEYKATKEEDEEAIKEAQKMDQWVKVAAALAKAYGKPTMTMETAPGLRKERATKLQDLLGRAKLEKMLKPKEDKLTAYQKLIW